MARFLFFPYFFPSVFQPLIDRMNEKPLIYDVDGSPISVCMEASLHKVYFNRCVWCNRSVRDIQSQRLGEETSIVQSQMLPPLDLDSPTTATVNPPRFTNEHQKVLDVKEGVKPSIQELEQVVCYCLKCRTKVPVLEPHYVEEETTKGTRRYLKGSCAICKTKMSAIVKREA